MVHLVQIEKLELAIAEAEVSLADANRRCAISEKQLNQLTARCAAQLGLGYGNGLCS